MKKLSILVLLAFAFCFSIPKPMESIENYNILLLHGAYGSSKGFLNISELEKISEAYYASKPLDNGAQIGRYDEKPNDKHRLIYWLGTRIFEESYPTDQRISHMYHYRSFSNPANSSSENAYELGDRTWNLPKTPYCSRRALIEEAQEVKSRFIVNPRDSTTNLYGQVALDSIRKYSDLYRQIPSRYILIGHSMGGVVAREYTQNSDYYHNEVDKVITLDSPHEGTGALNMQLDLVDHKRNTINGLSNTLVTYALLFATTQSDLMSKTVAVAGASWATLFMISNIAVPYIIEKNLQNYTYDDPLVNYVDPSKKGKGHIDYLKHIAPHDSMPMFRLLGGDSSITYTDPYKEVTDKIGLIIPEELMMGFSNFFSQISESDNAMSSHTFTLASKAATLGFISSVSAREQGTNLVSKSSGWAMNTESLNSDIVDVKKARFNAAPENDATAWRKVQVATASVASVCMGIDIALSWYKPAAMAANVAAVLGSSAFIGNMLVSLLSENLVKEVSESHNLLIEAATLDKLKSPTNTISKITGEDSYTPYLMEDFLYERPFVNLAMLDSLTLDSLQKNPKAKLNRNCFYLGARDKAICAVGLFAKNNEIYTTQKMQDVDKLQPLKFHSEMDWNKMGVKVDRWERVAGLTPEGSVVDTLVPIRHVERYEVPAISVDDWIYKYSFVVDDLMPHRLRQIKMNFNYQEEIAWECDIQKDYNASDACSVYKRKLGEKWEFIRKEKHPVKKNGEFEFEPLDYGYENLLALQKDNQNTLTISTVNKIGLSNTQRLYFLFKATDNLLEPIWPKADIVVNKIEGFKAYASALDYQGFYVTAMKDSIWECVHGDCTDAKPLSKSLMAMNFENEENSGKIFASNQNANKISEGEYVWQFKTIVLNSMTQTTDTSDTYNVYFRADTTAPRFEITTDSYNVNPDSSAFVARFKWDTTASKIPDIRAMRWTLENIQDAKKYELKSLYDVSSSEFAIPWGNVNKSELSDGLYRVTAFAIDYALPNKAAYDAVNQLVSKIAANTATDKDWETLNQFDLNRGESSVDFYIDRTAPTLDAKVKSAAGFASSSKYENLKCPPRENTTYISKDSLLQISYSVAENGGNRDSSLARVNWKFSKSGGKIYAHAFDSLWVVKNSSQGFWNETEENKLKDGDYTLDAVVYDEAKNARKYSNIQKFRVDRTAPNIESLVSNHLVYPDSNKNFSATIKVSEKEDVADNRTGMLCYYQISGGNAEPKWTPISDKVLHENSITFNIDSNLVGNQNGKRYLSALCIDAAGNANTRTDLFHVGDRYPSIVSPRADKTYLTSEYIPITGIAAPNAIDDENSTVYRLRYRYENSEEWLTENIFVSRANQSDNANISKTAQSSEGLLGYLHNVNFPAESRVVIELGVRGCPTCSWRTDSTIVTLDSVTASEENPLIIFNVSPKTIIAGEGSLNVSLKLAGNFEGSYSLRVYAEDSKGNSFFDKSSNKIFRNLFYGSPHDTTKLEGVWFYKVGNLYHLKWKGLSDTSKIQLSFDSKTFGNPCVSENGVFLLKGCEVENLPMDFSNISFIPENYSNDFPELQIPTNLDKVMNLTGNSGHVVMQSTGAFRVASALMNSSYKVPVYLGSNKTAGFDFDVSDNLNPLQIGWTVNPQKESLDFVWNGLSSTKTYPAEGDVKLYAEVIQNTSENPYMMLDSQIVSLKLPELKIAIPTLQDFYMIQNNISETSDLDDENYLYELASMNIPYGILGRDAFVSIRVKNQKGKIVKVLQDSIFTKANSNEKIYSANWNATDSNNFAVTPGTYYIEILAQEVGTKQKIVKNSNSFEVSNKAMIFESSISTDFLISEAENDNGKNRYIPVADYLLKTDFKAKYLPKEKRECVVLDASIKGTQQVYGYDPKRFSLAIRRHRKQLDLVVIRHLHTKIEYVDGEWSWGIFGCEDYRGSDQEKFYIDTLHFTSDVRSKKLSIHKVAKDDDSKYGYADRSDYDENYMDMIVLTLSGWETYLNDLGNSDLAKATSLRNSKGESLDAATFDTIKNRPEVIWSLGSLTKESNGFKIPKPDSEKSSVMYSANAVLGCKVFEKEGVLENSCAYGKSKTTEGYNPNANLFEIEMSAIKNGKFYAEKNKLNSNCDRERYRYIYFSIQMKIPDTYWDAPFGYDNLVNRTIRFDHTNKTIFAKDESDNNGYWNALIKKYNETQDLSFIGNGSYFDGGSWHLDKTYGLLTPFEMQSLSFLPASKLSGGENIFLFADEDALHEQLSYFDLKFYGAHDANDYFQALVLGNALDNFTACDMSKMTNFDAAYGNTSPRCQIAVTSKPNASGFTRTPLFASGWVQ